MCSGKGMPIKKKGVIWEPNTPILLQFLSSLDVLIKVYPDITMKDISSYFSSK